MDLKPLNPMVILAHANLYHANDAENLVQQGFRVILQKPYAINQDKLQILENILDHYPQRLALVESYQTWNALLFPILGWRGKIDGLRLTKQLWTSFHFC